jgi:hypothetical protein
MGHADAMIHDSLARAHRDRPLGTRKVVLKIDCQFGGA